MPTRTKINIRGYTEVLKISGQPRRSPRDATAWGRAVEAAEQQTAKWVRDKGAVLGEEIVAYMCAQLLGKTTAVPELLTRPYYIQTKAVFSRSCTSWTTKFCRRHCLRFALVQPKFRRTKNGESLTQAIDNSYADFYKLREAIQKQAKGEAFIHVGNMDETYTRRACPRRVVVDHNTRDEMAGGNAVRLSYDHCKSGLGIFVFSCPDFQVLPIIQLYGVPKKKEEVLCFCVVYYALFIDQCSVLSAIGTCSTPEV